jgi:outer membrane protein assembly factor BamD (BamD/ComL family)
LKQDIGELEENKTSMEIEYQNGALAVKKLSEAMALFLEGKPAKCVDLIETINTVYLDADSIEMVNKLQLTAGEQAGKILFDEGYELYLDRKYVDAASKLELSYIYAPEEEFSDKCLYYTSYSELKAGNKIMAVEKMTLLIEKFPESKYLARAKSFVKRYEQ